ncbi:uncharacterized protein Kmn1 [Drosophila virilis]|uniref:Uncharacterized protein n=1 Tax=Drosophila virilis TaxID=7244 RepID=B4MAN7_DROVI|nr:uncharacterized protein LOC6634740 [Drosophila virilis]EDW66296.1 uncharacterized protein Dvir_GJ15948 [Drosophila virilis]
MEAEANISCEGEKCFNSPTARLSDVDDISDIDVEDVVDKLHKTITSKPVYDEKRSIFNTTLDLAEAGSICETTGAAIEAYMESVVQEKQNWDSFATKYMHRPGSVGPAGGVSYRPSEEQLAYLNQGPNLQGFIRGFSTFMNDAMTFMLEFEEIQEIQENLKECCQSLTCQIQRITIAESQTNRMHNE